jgi:hypothetical protein
MSDLEFDVLDELYFVQHFKDLLRLTDLEEHEIKKTLQLLIAKNWVRCFKDASTEVPSGEIDFELEFRNYYYLASKEGLLAHNGR